MTRDERTLIMIASGIDLAILTSLSLGSRKTNRETGERLTRGHVTRHGRPRQTIAKLITHPRTLQHGLFATTGDYGRASLAVINCSAIKYGARKHGVTAEQ